MASVRLGIPVEDVGARAYNYFKDVLAPDPGCIYNVKEWEEVKKAIKEGIELPHRGLLIPLNRR